MALKTVVAISSFVMRGSVGLRPIGFALERRGLRVMAVPTVIMPWHPGIGASTRTVMDALPAQLEELATVGGIDAILTGYFASAEQVRATARFIDAVRRASPATTILIDPVTGDEPGRYVPDSVVDAIVAELLPRADIATPNAHELADFGGADDPQEAARRLGPELVVVTSGVRTADSIGAIMVEGERSTVVEHPAVTPCPHGTGDLFASVFLSCLLAGSARADALVDAAAATFAVVRGSDGEQLAFAALQEAIAHPPRDLVRLRPPR